MGAGSWVNKGGFQTEKGGKKTGEDHAGPSETG